MPFKLLKRKSNNSGRYIPKQRGSTYEQSYTLATTIAASNVMDLLCDMRRWSPSLTNTLSHFQPLCGMWLALDILTHEVPLNILRNHHWEIGQFGHMCYISGDSLHNFRAIRIGWSTGRFEATSNPLTKSLLIKPNGFVITKAATLAHGVTMEKVVEHGSPLALVLNSFLADLAFVRYHGGRLCVHHAEFVMGIIKHEMEHAGLEIELEAFGRFATGAFCTLNSDIIGWVCPGLVGHVLDQSSNDHQVAIRFKDMARVLLPDQVVLCNYHLEAGAISRITWLMVRTLFLAAAQAAAKA